MTASALDGIPGLGETKRKALLRHFGSVKKIRAASEEDLRAVSGIGPALASTIAAQLSRTSPATPAVNLMTGEVIDDDEEQPSA
jgi:excinuclease ABC subunit C